MSSEWHRKEFLKIKRNNFKKKKAEVAQTADRNTCATQDQGSLPSAHDRQLTTSVAQVSGDSTQLFFWLLKASKLM